MKIFCILLALIIVPNTLNAQCDSITVSYQVDHLQKESKKKEIFFTNVPKDTVQINFNDGFGNGKILVRIDGLTKSLNEHPDESLGYTGNLRFKKPKGNSSVAIEYMGSKANIIYNESYNMIYLWFSECSILVRHTNRSIMYE